MPRLLLTSLVAAVLLAACSTLRDVEEEIDFDAADATAVAEISALDGGTVEGTVRFEEADGFVRVTGTVGGLPAGKHGFHIHEGTSCAEPGGHFNPTNEPHGSPDEPERHDGDLGNFVIRDDGSGRFERVDRRITLTGDRSVAGHALILHGDADEYLPQPSGDAGDMVACGIIELQ